MIKPLPRSSGISAFVMPSKNNPLVSVICIGYRHGAFILKALESVHSQSYPNIEFIIVDNGSEDGSASIITNWAVDKEVITLMFHQNLGHCLAFNQALALAKGKYVVDLSGDDVLHKNRIERQVDFFETQSEEVGVIYHRAMRVDEAGKELTEWRKGGDFFGQSGDLFGPLLMRTFIATPTMMMRRSLLQQLNGYNEQLSFEDFDFWLRSSRICRYAFQNELLTFWRIHRASQSHAQLHSGKRRMLSDVAQVMNWAKSQLRNEAEEEAFRHGCAYYLRQAWLIRDSELVRVFYRLAFQQAFSPVNWFLSKTV